MQLTAFQRPKRKSPRVSKLSVAAWSPLTKARIAVTHMQVRTDIWRELPDWGIRSELARVLGLRYRPMGQRLLPAGVVCTSSEKGSEAMLPAFKLCPILRAGGLEWGRIVGILGSQSDLNACELVTWFAI